MYRTALTKRYEKRLAKSSYPSTVAKADGPLSTLPLVINGRMPVARRPKRGRIVYPELSDSRRVARLSITGALLWTWLLPHADDQGRLAGDAAALRDRLVPHFAEITAEDVETALQAMEREHLVLRYVVHRQHLIQISDWWKWQARLKYKRPSYHQAPDGWRDRITVRIPQGGYVARLSADMSVLCPNCSYTVAPSPYGGLVWSETPGKRGWVCPQCDAELLGTRSARPKVGGMQTRRTGKARELVLAALASGPQTKGQLAVATGYSESTIGTLLPVLRGSGDVVRVSKRRPWTYRRCPATDGSAGSVGCN